MVTFFLPKTGSSLSSARISRLFCGFCRLFFLICVQILLTASVRGKGLSPTTCANSFDGCNGFIRPELLLAAVLRPEDFFAGALLLLFEALVLVFDALVFAALLLPFAGLL